jgi:hypothetical protein
VFTFSGLPNGFSLSDITNVSFEYGTNTKETAIASVPLVPEPTTLMLVAAGLGMLTFTTRRRAR